MTDRTIICSFSSHVADLGRSQRTEANVLRALQIDPRVSCFDQGERPWLARIIRYLLDDGLIVSDPDEPYPWNRYTLTDKGRAMLADVREVG